jgi:hypothetical protein
LRGWSGRREPLSLWKGRVEDVQRIFDREFWVAFVCLLI